MSTLGIGLGVGLGIGVPIICAVLLLLFFCYPRGRKYHYGSCGERELSITEHHMLDTIVLKTRRCNFIGYVDLTCKKFS